MTCYLRKAEAIRADLRNKLKKDFPELSLPEINMKMLTSLIPGQPWKNSFIESFHDKFRDECLQREWFSSPLDAQVVIADWRLHYNTQRLHSSLGYKTPAAFADQYATPFQPAQTLIPLGHKN